MSAQIIQFIPRPNPNRKPLEKQAAEILSQIDTASVAGIPTAEMIPYHGAGIDGMKFEAPPEDCA
jgi:hypothetical protein